MKWLLLLLGWGFVLSSFLFLLTWMAAGPVTLWALLKLGVDFKGVEGTLSEGLVQSIIAGVILLGSGVFVLYRFGNRRS